jgi:hypothetical protein
MSTDYALKRYTDDTPMHAHLRTRIAELQDKTSHQLRPVDRNELIRSFGMGDQPKLRMALYGRLEQAYQDHGAAVARVVWNTARRALKKTHPGRWFATVVLSELRSADLIDQASPDC